MTKVQIKAVLQAEVNDAWNNHQEDTKIFDEMAALCEQHGDGHKWVSLQKALVEIIRAGDDKATHRALYLFEKFFTQRGELQMIERVVSNTNNLNF